MKYDLHLWDNQNAPCQTLEKEGVWGKEGIAKHHNEGLAQARGRGAVGNGVGDLFVAAKLSSTYASKCLELKKF